ncbi:equilibrative nucleoside transporter 3-like [Uloborus diversus]|uniref:equilibrative nucleoside transporter 3-like n=1 Tax=Uloborus diversus TaxID=327109 RepID=UPI00240A2168|nr:equilibrative nucleoside transporter 3-like [Uloborus diversus]
MSLRTPYYSDYNPNDDRHADQQYLMPSSGRGRNGLPDSFYRGDTMPLRHMSSNASGDIPTSQKKRIGTLDVINPMEQETLLDPGPVRLQPGWESRNAPSDELNYKTMTPKVDFDGKPPVDRLNLVFLIFMLHGVGTLMPWNMFITAKSYFVDFKLKINETDGSTEEYREHFLSYLGVASQVPNVICNALNIFVQFGGGSVTFRIIGSILIEIVIFILTVVLAMLDSSSWAGAFFYITMASVVILNMANGIYQNSLYGLAAKLPMKYSMAIVLGSNTSGTFTSLILLLSIAAFVTRRSLQHNLRFFNRQIDLHQKNVDVAIRNFQSSFSVKLSVFKLIFLLFLAIYIVKCFVQFNFSDAYFTPVTCYLCFNFFAMLGSLFPNWVKWPGPKYLWIPVVLRILMIPYFMLCNYKPDKRQLPVLIDNDWAYFGMAVALGLSSGYYSSLAMMYAPGCVDTEHAPIAGMISALFLVLGIVCGVNFTFFVSWLIETNLF